MVSEGVCQASLHELSLFPRTHARKAAALADTCSPNMPTMRWERETGEPPKALLTGQLV